MACLTSSGIPFFSPAAVVSCRASPTALESVDSVMKRWKTRCSGRSKSVTRFPE